MPRDSSTPTFAEAYGTAFRGRDVASIRKLQTMRCGLTEREQWVADCLFGSGLSASEIVGGDTVAAARLEAVAVKLGGGR